MTKSNYILVTGGAGYIGSHMVRLLLEDGLHPLIFDDLSTGYREFIPSGVPFIQGDLRNPSEIAGVFSRYHVKAVMHFAASIVVPESVVTPLKYYDNNVGGTINLLQAVVAHKVDNFIFSSSAAVYGNPLSDPITEDEPAKPNNPYGASKWMIERILQDVAAVHKMRYVSLRYFNVAGAHPSGEIGVKSEEVTHLIPSIVKTASGKKAELILYGDDYDTPDGSCIRDYIYVMDLCQAHLQALKALENGLPSSVFNLGTSQGYSVKNIVAIAEQVIGKKLNVRIGPRRRGDSVRLVASNAKAKKILGWEPQTPVEEIIRTAWRWEQSLD